MKDDNRDEEDMRQSEWVKSIKAKEAEKVKNEGKSQKEHKLSAKRNKVIFNYGVMQDFFSYSGMDVQYSLQNSDLSKPSCPAGIRGGSQPQAEFRSMAL